MINGSISINSTYNIIMRYSHRNRESQPVFPRFRARAEFNTKSVTGTQAMFLPMGLTDTIHFAVWPQ